MRLGWARKSKPLTTDVHPPVASGSHERPCWARLHLSSQASDSPSVVGIVQPILGGHRMSWAERYIAASHVVEGRASSCVVEDKSGSTERLKDLTFAPCCWPVCLQESVAAAERIQESCPIAPTEDDSLTRALQTLSNSA